MESNSDKIDENGTIEQHDRKAVKIRFEDWGFKIDRLFEVAYRFYKRNESKAFHPTFDIRNQMNALVLQARYGNFDDAKAPDVGVFDLIGKRRRHEWSLLKGMSRAEAMSKFICTLDDICPFFKAHAEAVKLSSNLEYHRPHKTNTSSVNGTHKQSPQDAIFPPESNEQLRAIHSSLCRQTYNQFKSYAEKQFPNDVPKQKQMISTLQEQYYQQYISQMHPDLRASTSVNGRQNGYKNNNTYQTCEAPLSEAQTVDHQHANQPSLIEATKAVDINSEGAVEVGLYEEETKAENGPIKSSSNNLKISNEENHIETDISSEELNANTVLEDGCNNLHISTDSQTNYQPSSQQSQVHSNIDTLQPNMSMSMSMSQNYIEPVKLYQNVELQIGSFESFPEPKPIKTPQQNQNNIPTDMIDQNLPQSSEDSDHLYEQSANNPYKMESFPVTPQLELPPIAEQMLHSNVVERQEQQAESISESISLESSQNLILSYQPPEETRYNEGCPCSVNTSELPPDLWSCGSSDEGCNSVVQNISYEAIEPATTWNKKGVAEFKSSLGGDKHGGIYEVKQGTLVVIKVPTYPDGKYIYWEFATDDYDIAFGLDFIYETHLVEPLALNIYEESTDDEDEELLEDENWQSEGMAGWDSEMGYDQCHQNDGQLVDSRQSAFNARRAEKIKRLNNTVPVVPTYRRNSHEEVFVGRHKYPGRGYYLLKFDNTYSVLRSKSLYFRICYFL